MGCRSRASASSSSSKTVRGAAEPTTRMARARVGTTLGVTSVAFVLVSGAITVSQLETALGRPGTTGIGLDIIKGIRESVLGKFIECRNVTIEAQFADIEEIGLRIRCQPSLRASRCVDEEDPGERWIHGPGHLGSDEANRNRRGPHLLTFHFRSRGTSNRFGDARAVATRKRWTLRSLCPEVRRGSRQPVVTRLHRCSSLMTDEWA